MRRIFHIAKYELYMVFFSAKFWMLILIAWIFMDTFHSGIVDLAADYGLTMPAAALPFYYADGIYCNAGFLIYIFLISDAPFRENNQVYLLERSGRRVLCAGQMLSLCIISVLFTLFQFLMSVLEVLPYIGFGGWGKVWGSFADTTAMMLGYSATAEISQGIITAYTPLQAVLITVLLVSLMGMCYGMAEYLLNSISGGKAGTAVISIWSLSWLCLSNLSGNRIIRKILQASPQRWLNLEGVSLDGLGRKCISIIAVILILAAANLWIEKKKEA